MTWRREGMRRTKVRGDYCLMLLKDLTLLIEGKNHSAFIDSLDAEMVL